MAELNHKQYDILERAILAGDRIAAYRRGTDTRSTMSSVTAWNGCASRLSFSSDTFGRTSARTSAT